MTPFEFGDELPGRRPRPRGRLDLPRRDRAPHSRAPRARLRRRRRPLAGVDGLTFVPDDLMDDPARDQAGLLDAYRSLLELDFDLLLLAHGQPERDGKRALRDFTRDHAGPDARRYAASRGKSGARAWIFHVCPAHAAIGGKSGGHAWIFHENRSSRAHQTSEVSRPGRARNAPGRRRSRTAPPRAWPMLRHPSTRSLSATSTSPERTAGVRPAICTWTSPLATATIPVPLLVARPAGLARVEVHEVDPQLRVAVAEQRDRALEAALGVLGPPPDPVDLGILAVEQVVDRDAECGAEPRERREREASFGPFGLGDRARRHARRAGRGPAGSVRALRRIARSEAATRAMMSAGASTGRRPRRASAAPIRGCPRRGPRPLRRARCARRRAARTASPTRPCRAPSAGSPARSSTSRRSRRHRAASDSSARRSRACCSRPTPPPCCRAIRTAAAAVRRGWQMRWISRSRSAGCCEPASGARARSRHSPATSNGATGPRAR